MADYYTQFSEGLTNITPEEEAWLNYALRCFTDESEEILTDGNLDADKVEAICKAEPWYYDNGGGLPVLGFDAEFETNEPNEGGRTLKLYAEENGAPWCAAALVQTFFKKFRPNAVWSLCWADTCNRMRVGAFGGGAIVVSADDIQMSGSEYWIKRQMAYHAKYGKWKKRVKVRKYNPGAYKGLDESEIIEARSWDDSTLGQLMANFIVERDLVDEWVAFLADQARKEAKGDPR